jgi:hypothetical protein
VETSNSCVRSLIFSSFLLLPFIKFYFPYPFRFFDLAFYYLFSFFLFDFLSPFVFPLLFHSCFVPVFFAHVVSSLAYPTYLRIKGLVVIVVDDA